MKFYYIRTAIFTLIFLFTTSRGFNLETRIPVIKQGASGSYFGYSVAEHRTVIKDSDFRQNWLLVGAPLGRNLQPGTNRSGALWKCPVTPLVSDCEQVITDGKLSKENNGQYDKTIENDDLREPLNNEIKEDQWLGVTVSSQGEGMAVVCAHRYIWKRSESMYGQGLCYTLNNELKYNDNHEPCRGLPTGREHEEYSYCQAGISSAVLSDDTLIVGSPGPHTWRGTVFAMDINENFFERDKHTYRGPLEVNSPVDKYSYLGMSVTGAPFFTKNMSYAVGGPRSEGTGQVVIFSKHKNGNEILNPINVSKIISGEKFGSNFGYELTSGDFNADGKPDLVVGAPFFFSQDAGGAVYVYINKNNDISSNYDVKLTGKPESRFGFALTNAGDLNKDGCDDLAIGSPYEDNGVVYIYFGNKITGLDNTPKQVIRSEMLPLPIKTFGYSLSGGMDMDDNGYPDLLVGAYEEDKIVLMRGRPIIDIKTHVQPEIKNIDPSKKGCQMDPESNLTCFSFETCCKIESLVKPSNFEILKLNYVIEAETFAGGRKFSRVYFGGAADNRKLHIIKSEIKMTQNFHCKKHLVYIKENTRDIQSAIKFHVNYTLVQVDPKWEPYGDLPSVEGLPILNATHATLEFEAGLLRDCGTDDVCEHNITVLAELALPKDDKGKYILSLGQEDEVRLIVTTDNLEEAAYEAQLFISHHPRLDYIAASVTDKHVICNLYNNTMVSCSLGNPFKKQVKANPIILRFDPKAIDDLELSIDFKIWANSTSKDKNPNRKPTIVKAQVVKNAELTIKGSARPEQVFYGGVVKGESAMEHLDDIGSRILHTYQVFNLGPWRVNSLEVVIDWPHQVANNKPQGKWLLYLDSIPTVDTLGEGECFVSPKYVNPLGLTPRPGLEEPPLENLRLDPFFSTSETLSDEGIKNISEIGDRFRRKRDTEMIVKSEAYTDKDGMKHQIVNMNCQQGTAKCVTITCMIYKLSRNQEATIRIRARLWNSSLVEDYPRVARVSVASKARIRLPTHFNIHQNNIDDDVAVVETIAYPDLVSVEPSGVPLWVYIVSILAGIILLILFILILWKCGFFKRMRPDPTLSGNIEKNHEDMPFIEK